MPIFGGLTAQVDWLGLRVGGHPALSLHSSDEPGAFGGRAPPGPAAGAIALSRPLSRYKEEGRKGLEIWRR